MEPVKASSRRCAIYTRKSSEEGARWSGPALRTRAPGRLENTHRRSLMREDVAKGEEAALTQMHKHDEANGGVRWVGAYSHRQRQSSVNRYAGSARVAAN